jgi:hypothetical protein
VLIGKPLVVPLICPGRMEKHWPMTHMTGRLY